MTVGQLTRLLQNYPQDMRVVVDGYEDGYDRLPRPPYQIFVVKISRRSSAETAVGTVRCFV